MLIYAVSTNSTDLNRAIVCRPFLPFKISWFHLSGFVVQFTNASLWIIAIGMNINRLATVVFDAFKLTFKLINNSYRVHGMTKYDMALNILSKPV